MLPGGCAVKQDEDKTGSGPGSVTTHETVGKSLHFCASLHLQGISSTQNGSKHPGLQLAQLGNLCKVFFSIQNKN